MPSGWRSSRGRIESRRECCQRFAHGLDSKKDERSVAETEPGRPASSERPASTVALDQLLTWLLAGCVAQLSARPRGASEWRATRSLDFLGVSSGRLRPVRSNWSFAERSMQKPSARFE